MVKELSAEQVRLYCEPSFFQCDSTKDMAPSQVIIGQDRAISALKFGLNMPKPGFNIFASGPSGTGRTTAIKSFLEAIASKKAVPSDWCYVHNFKDAYQPNALKLSPGQGKTLEQDMKHVMEEAQGNIAQAFASKQYSERRDEITEKFNKQRESAFEDLRNRARTEGFFLQTTPFGLAFLPVINEEPMSEEQYQKLKPEEQSALRQKQDILMRQLKEQITALRAEEGTLHQQLEEADREMGRYAIDHLFQGLKDKYREQEEVVSYFNDVEKDIIENLDQFKAAQTPAIPDGTNPLAAMQTMLRGQALRKYEVNVVIDNSNCKGAPVILELNPSFSNLVGRIEREAQFGALLTDFTMLRAGSIHRANGGFLVLRMQDILQNFQSWEALKRALRDHEIVIEDISERLGYIATKTIKPEPIPLDIKVVVIGEPSFYYALTRFDPEFHELFKVRADFDTRMERNDKNMKDFASVICRMVQDENLMHLKSDALAKVIEYSARLADDQDKLSTMFSEIADVIREANFWASEDNAEMITGKHIQKAIEERIYRSNLIQQRINEMIEKNIIKIDTEEAVIGQVNGLEVMGLGDFAFGKPARITSTVGVGREGVIDIEREVKLGGPIHSKGVMILNGYIIGKYARNFPLSLSARLVFEQSYEGVEGDSASGAELYALLSRLADAPVKQSFACTGSVNQKGEIQAIGGVNQKLEGFFEVCKAKGLTGNQGCIIPQSNVKHLMLKEEVVQAVRDGKFHIFPVTTVDEAMEILTGVRMGPVIDGGIYEPGTINDRVLKKLQFLAENFRDFARMPEEPAHTHA